MFVEEVGDADAEPVDLVGVRWPDAATGGADLLLPRNRSVTLSIVEWYDAITWAFADTTSCSSTSTPSAVSASTSRNSASGDTTTPLPMTLVQPLVRHAGQQVGGELLAVDDDRVAGAVAPDVRTT